MFRKALILISVIIALGLAYKLATLIFENNIVVENSENIQPESLPILTPEISPTIEVEVEKPTSPTPTPTPTPASVPAKPKAPTQAPAPTPTPPPSNIDNDISDLEQDLNSFDFDSLDSGL